MPIFKVAGDNEPDSNVDQTVDDKIKETSGDEPTLNTNINADGVQVPQTADQEKTVVLDGPLGRIYTQALNLAYAKEDTGTMAMIIDAANRERQEKESTNPDHGVYVYATDTDHLDNRELVEITNWMTTNQKNDQPMVISLESVGNKISNKSGLLEEMAKAHGVTVHYSRNSAMKAIRSQMKK